MRQKRHSGGNNRNRNNGGRGKFRGGNDSQSLARQKKHAQTQKEKYQNMARDAQVNGERVDAEYYYQHVEHYVRVLAEIEAKEPKPQKREESTDDAEAAAAEGEASAQTQEDAQAEADDAQAAKSDAAGDDTPAEKPKATRSRRRPAADRKPREPRESRHKAEEIPLPASVIPEAEPIDSASSAQ